MSDAVTRKEAYLKSIGDGTSSALKPITREEQYLAYIAGESNSFPTNPITREEAFLDKIAKSGVSGGGGGSSGGGGGSGGGAEYGMLCEEDYYEEGCVKLIVDMPVPIPVTVRFRQSNDNDIIVDWGDGSTNTYAYSGNGQSPSHTYTTAGIKVIKLIPTENATRLQLGVTTTDYLFGENNFTSSYGLRKLYIGTPIASLTGTGGAGGMTKVVIGKVKSMGTQAFYGSTVLQALDIPDGITAVSSGLCYYCYGLKKVTLPKTITTVYANAFDTCSMLVIVDFSKCESVPSLSASSFMTASSRAQILVPSALYDEWINATNWSAVADKIVAV